MKRIMIFGRPGSGKSTFAFKLHKKLNIPLYHLDKYFYINNWVERNYEEFLEIQNNLVNDENWIIDGNCTSSLEKRYSRATYCIYFNLSKYICYYRLLKRFFNKDKSIDDRAENCTETINWKLIKYMWTFEKRVHEKIFFLKNKYPKVIFLEFNKLSDINFDI